MKQFAILMVASWILLTFTAQGQETQWEPRVSLSFPYLIEPITGHGDTSMSVGLDYEMIPGVLLYQGLQVGVIGDYLTRFEWIPTYRAFRSRLLNPQIGFGGIVQVHDSLDGGFTGRLGLSWDLRRVMDLWYLRLTIETGATVLLRRPRTLEVELTRVSLSFPF